MKKVLLPVFLFFCLCFHSAAFDIDWSESPITVSGFASLTWGFDFDTKANGFVNSASLGMEFPLLSKITPVAEGEGLHGSIEIVDLEWVLSQDSGSSLASSVGGNIVAKLIYDPFWLGIYSKPKWSFNKNVNISSDNDGDIQFSGFSNYSHGTTLGYMDPDVPFEAELMVSSMNGTDWRDNTDGNYCFGTNLAAFLFDYQLEVRGSFAFDYSPDILFYGGIEIPLEFYVLDGLTIRPAADFRYLDEFAFDAGLEAALHFSPKNNDDLSSYLGFQVFFGQDKDLSLSLCFFEPTVEGVIDHLGFSIEGDFVDVIKSPYLTWNMKTTAEYEILFGNRQSILPSVVYTLDYQLDMSLKAIVKWSIKAIQNTEITIGYYSGDFFATPLLIGYMEATVKLTL